MLVTRRHLEANDELSDDEAIELGLLLQRVSAALKEVTGCIKTYVIQFNESPDHPHIHIHVVPRMADQPEERRGRNVFSYLDVSEDVRVSDDKMNEIALQLREILNRFED